MEYDSDGPDVPQLTAYDLIDDGQSDGRFSGRDSDEIKDFLSYCDNPDEGHNETRRKPIVRNPQGVLLS